MVRFFFVAWGVVGLMLGSPVFHTSVSAQESLRELQTVAEKSKFTATCLSPEVESFVQACDQAAVHVSTMEFGRTAENRPMTAAICANPPFQIDRIDGTDQRGIALVIGNIHSGECCGKEAILQMLREIAIDPEHALLKNLVIVFVPNYNADANDRVSKDNRPGQVGPEKGMGQRETSQGYDLNRDFVKLDSPEGRAMIGLIDRLNPDLFIDCHTTNGSRHQYELTYDIPHNPSSSLAIREMMRNEMMPEITQRLETKKLDSFYYGNFDRGNTKWTTYGFEPRYSTEYVGLRGRLAVLSEAYSYIPFEERIHVTYEFVTECLKYTSENLDSIKKLLHDSDQQWMDSVSKNSSTGQIVLNAELTAFDKPYEIKGYQDGQPTNFTVQFFTHYVPTIERRAPQGYLVPGTLTGVVEKLKSHGIDMRQLSAEQVVPVEAAIIRTITTGRTFQKHAMKSLKVEFEQSQMTFKEGDWFVPTRQPLGRLACYVLEAETNDGFVTWNLLDDHLSEGAAFPIFRTAVDQDSLKLTNE